MTMMSLKFQWHHRDVINILMMSWLVFQVTGLGEATVSLVPPELEDAGEYLCVAENEIGTAVRQLDIIVMREFFNLCIVSV